MKRILRIPLSARVAAAVKRLHTQARDALRADGYRPEKHYMRGPGPRSGGRGADRPELPAQ